eukprot:TRINITY_DN3856_c1_g1_i1.p1 TRINITY_DN3856_c1_g1~~TRINITY_DN3856_c1_g1_i1.p1  ORF type:complete len:364 (-),score=25.42 TRINITY_DN3856_c1_g1_i1:183-1274(-)
MSNKFQSLPYRASSGDVWRCTKIAVWFGLVLAYYVFGGSRPASQDPLTANAASNEPGPKLADAPANDVLTGVDTKPPRQRSSGQKKIALCLSGGIRMYLTPLEVEEVQDGHRVKVTRTLEDEWLQNAIEPNQADVFGHLFAWSDDERQAYETFAGRPYVKASVIEAFDDSVKAELAPFMDNPTREFHEKLAPGFERLMSMWRKIYKCHELIRSYEKRYGLQYDIYVRARPDIMHPKLVNYSKCEDGRLCIPASPYFYNCSGTCPPKFERVTGTKCRLGPDDCGRFKCHECGNINDKYAWGNAEAMQLYVDSYHWMTNVTLPINPANAEHRLFQIFDQRGELERVFHTYDLDRLRRMFAKGERV